LIVALAAALGFLAGLFVAYFLEGREEAGRSGPADR
jgi:uncharacterized protein involved in exopolysaccharide biosynthesis